MPVDQHLGRAGGVLSGRAGENDGHSAALQVRPHGRRSRCREWPTRLAACPPGSPIRFPTRRRRRGDRLSAPRRAVGGCRACRPGRRRRPHGLGLSPRFAASFAGGRGRAWSSDRRLSPRILRGQRGAFLPVHQAGRTDSTAWLRTECHLRHLPHGHADHVAEALVGREHGGRLEAAMHQAVLAAGIARRARAGSSRSSRPIRDRSRSGRRPSR